MQPLNSDISYPYFFFPFITFNFCKLIFFYMLKNNPFSYMQSTWALKIQSMEN